MLRCDAGVEPSWTWDDVERLAVNTPGTKRTNSRVECQCAGCGKRFLKKADQVKEGRRDCCSRKCRAELQKKPIAMKACPGPGCGKEHSKEGTFCSHGCVNRSRGPRTEDFKEKVRTTLAAKMDVIRAERGYSCTPSQAKQREETHVPQYICQNESCGKPFLGRRGKPDSKRRFCSIICNGNSTQIRIPITCPGCRKVFLPVNGTVRYCSISCSHKYAYHRFIAEWLAGAHNVTTSDSTNKRIRRYLFEINDSRCLRPHCRWGEVHPVTGKVPLTVNHINGDPYDNRPENVELICPNCHSLTPNYCALNKGSGRKRRYGREQ